jgi:hypothetical protein
MIALLLIDNSMCCGIGILVFLGRKMANLIMVEICLIDHPAGFHANSTLLTDTALFIIFLLAPLYVSLSLSGFNTACVANPAEK